MNREEAMKKAIEDCIKRNVLKSFLEANSTEVINMLLKEWDLEEAQRVWERSGRQQGIQQGIQQGMQQLFDFLKKGHSLEEANKKFAFR